MKVPTLEELEENYQKTRLQEMLDEGFIPPDEIEGFIGFGLLPKDYETKEGGYSREELNKWIEENW